MLTQLSIKNYALIDDLAIDFSKGFTTITGETGAGKSILLGALTLVLGKRADLSSLKNNEKKCVVEAGFSISAYSLGPFFAEHDLDYEPQSVLRREILPSGKSRAFINDTPVTLDVMSKLGGQLVDVHSQHQTLQLAERDFQFKVVDALAENQVKLETYRQGLRQLGSLKSELGELLHFQETATKELDYNRFLLQELEEAQPKPGMMEELEAEHGRLGNVETIMEQLGTGYQLLNAEGMGVLAQLQQAKQAMGRLLSFGKAYEDLHGRLESILIEAQDITHEMDNICESVEADPQRLEQVNGQLAVLQNLLAKHQSATVDELLVIKENLADKVSESVGIASSIAAKENEIAKKEHLLHDLAMQLREHRERIIPTLQENLAQQLGELGMASARFQLKLTPIEGFADYGMDDLVFLFSANRGTDFGVLKKVASGGELSRIMLVIKSILAEYERLPTLLFDEIDTGVSGELSAKMGSIMKHMGQHMQVFAITHLPQVAAQGMQQFKVYKEEDANATYTQMKLLTPEDRITEVAAMLGGSSISDAATSHAKALLGQ